MTVASAAVSTETGSAARADPQHKLTECVSIYFKCPAKSVFVCNTPLLVFL